MNNTTAPLFTLYTTTKSGPGCKVLAACRHLKLPHELELVDVYVGEGQRPAYRDVNPFGKIPTLVEGDFKLWESNAILLYLAEVHGDYHLSSRDARARADLARWMFWESAHFQPSFGPVLTEFVSTALTRGRAAADACQVNWAQPPFQALCEFLDRHLQAERYVSGRALSIADFSVAGMFIYARAARFPFATYPGIAAWFSELERLPAWRDSQDPLWKA